MWDFCLWFSFPYLNAIDLQELPKGFSEKQLFVSLYESDENAVNVK